MWPSTRPHLYTCLIAAPHAQLPSALVLDVLLSRVGLSHFFQRLDDLTAAPSFLAARDAPPLPKPVTRASAAAALAEDDEGSLSGVSDPASASRVPHGLRSGLG